MQKYVGRTIEIIYMDRKGRFTKRRIRLLKIEGHVIKAYCLDQRGPRIFYMERILAYSPITERFA